MTQITIDLTDDEWKKLWKLSSDDCSMCDIATRVVKDFISAQQAGAGDVLRVSQSSGAVPGVVDEIEELWS